MAHGSALRSDVAPRASLADVARHCGLDKSTISKALNLPPDQFSLSADTRQRITEAVAKLGYRPSRQARALARGATQVVGLVYGQNTPPSGVYTTVQYGFSDVLASAGYSLQFFSLSAQQDQWQDLLGGQQIDAVAAISRFPDPFGDLLVKSPLPAVFMNLDVQLPIDRVVMDDAGGTRLALRHLMELGHRRIVFYSDAQVDSATRTHFSYGVRLDAFASEMSQAGLSGVEIAGRDGAPKLLDRVFEAGGTAVLIYSHLSAFALLHEVWRRGMSVPNDLSVITFNDVYPAAVTIPPLTTVTTVGQEMGRIAAQMLLGRLKSNGTRNGGGAAQERLAPQLTILEEHLIVRGSTAPPRGVASSTT